MYLSTNYWRDGLTNQPEHLRVSLVTPVKGISLSPFQMCSAVTEIFQSCQKKGSCPFDFIYRRTRACKHNQPTAQIYQQINQKKDKCQIQPNSSIPRPPTSIHPAYSNQPAILHFTQSYPRPTPSFLQEPPHAYRPMPINGCTPAHRQESTQQARQHISCQLIYQRSKSKTEWYIIRATPPDTNHSVQLPASHTRLSCTTHQRH